MKTLFCTFGPSVTEEEYDEYFDPGLKSSYREVRSVRRATKPSKQYAYLYTGNREVLTGDFAVVHNGTNFAVVHIERVKPGIDDKVIKHVLSVITRGDFEQYLKANEAIVDHRKVFDQLDYLIEEEKKMERYRELAKTNTLAADLLKRATTWDGPVIECHMSEPPVYGEPKTDTPNEGV